MRFSTFIGAMTISLALSAGAAASSRPSQSVEEIQRAVNTYARLTVFDDVTVSADGGTVTLSGKVTMPFKKEEIAKRVGAIDGVKAVRNEIGVLPASASDDELRQRVARAIYGNAAFWRYAAVPSPPIHILVEDSRVTLTGTVHSDADRALARSLVSGLGEVSVTNCLRAAR